MRARRGNAVWLALVACGLGLGMFVLAAWPEPTLKVVRLPYGEAMPKTPPASASVAVSNRTKPVAAPEAAPWEPAPPAPEAVEEEAAGRVLAVVEPSDEGPAPIPSPLDLDEGYVQEPPEKLGAEPLPGADLTPPVAG